jgi:branched-chain amino acid transport system permease protein
MRAGYTYAAYIALVGLLLALSGVFVSFANRDVITGLLDLNGALIVILCMSAGYLAVTRIGRGGQRVFAYGALAGLVVATPLVALALLERVVSLRFVFANLTVPVGSYLSFGLPLLPGLVIFVLLCLVLGGAGGVLAIIDPRARQVTLSALGATLLIALLADEVDSVLAPSDGFAVGLALVIGFVMSRVIGSENFWLRLLGGAINGAAVGVIFALIADGGGLLENGILRFGQSDPILLAVAPGASLLPLALIFAGVGIVGAVLATLPFVIAHIAYYGAALIFILALLALRRGFDGLDAALVWTISLFSFVLLPHTIRVSAGRFHAMSPLQQQLVRIIIYIGALGILLGAPLFLEQGITNILNLVGIYVILGIGLNTVVGSAGILDLGYVAYFAIGAYTVALMTTPNLLTCGLTPDQLAITPLPQTCAGVLPFWSAFAIAIVLSAVTGVLLSLSMLRLRSDYVAIVTLGFAEILRILLRLDDFRVLFGAGQGISNIPRPTLDLTTINPSWSLRFDSDTSIYFLLIAAIIGVIFIASRLNNSRIGRAWRALRADEAVARASGIGGRQSKLLAYAIGAGFAGLAGAISATYLLRVAPDDFTLQVSINVLSLVIIGGIGSIPGVILGAFLLIGLPEILTEFADYRLLIFGVLLIFTIIARPYGLLPAGLRPTNILERRA